MAEGVLSRLFHAAGEFFRQARQVAASDGKHPFAQLTEACRLKMQVGQFSMQDYFDFRLFEASVAAKERGRDLAGRRMQAFLEYELNDQQWKCAVDDKVMSYLLLRAANVPTPKLAAIFAPDGRSVEGVTCCDTPEALLQFLRTTEMFPLFAKPIRGSVGRGASAIVGYSRSDDSLVFANGNRMGAPEFVRVLADAKASKHARAGYIFQDLVRQHPSLLTAVGPTVSTARVVVLVGDDKRSVLTAVWRIARGANMTDNFDKGRSGNLLGAVDVSSGTVTRVISGYGLTEQVVHTHPDTGARLEGFRLPDWEQAADVVRRGATAFPNLRFQHWDVAFSAGGPRVLEVNAMGSTGMLQFASGKGLMTPELRAFLQRYGRTSSRSSDGHRPS